jgi:hypothetical protein
MKRKRLGVTRATQLEGQTDIFLWTERLESRYALLQAWRGFENTRIALAKWRQRLEKRTRPQRLPSDFPTTSCVLILLRKHFWQYSIDTQVGVAHVVASANSCWP